MAILDCFIPGDPISKGRPRANPNGGRSYTPKRTKDAENVLKLRMIEALPLGFVAVEEPVGIAVEFFCATRRPTDGDNLLKLVTDAMNGLVLQDDSQILEWFARLHRGVGQADAGTKIFVYPLE